MTLEEQLAEAIRQRDEWRAKWSVAIQTWELVSTELAALKATAAKPETVVTEVVAPAPQPFLLPKGDA